MASTDNNRQNDPSDSPTANWPTNWTVRRVAETGSTNADLFSEAERGAKHHSVLFADHQTAGRGRLDRTWEAQSGANLLVSLLFRETDSEISLCQRVVAVSAVRACRKFLDGNAIAGDSINLKWPNDLLLNQKKFGGMLSVADVEQTFVVVGLGINVLWAPEYAAKLTDLPLSGTCTPIDLLRVLLEQINVVENLSTQELYDEYVAALSTLNQLVRVELVNGNIITGRATALDASGRLVVDAQGEKHSIETGDVVHLRDVNRD